MKNKNNIWVLILLAILIIVVTFSYRNIVFDNVIVGDYIYNDLWISEQESSPLLDSFHLFLMQPIKWIQVENLLIILSFLFAIPSVILFYLILDGYKVNKKLSLLIVTLFILSPQFISSFTISFRSGFSILLLFIGYYLFFTKKRKLLGTFFLILFSITNFANTLVILLLLIGYSMFDKKDRVGYIMSTIGFVILSSMYYIFYYLKNGFPNLDFIFEISTFHNAISDFGGVYGIGIFKVMLALIGIKLLWRKNLKVALSYFFIGLIIVYTILVNDYLFYNNIIFSFLSGYAIFYYYKQKWDLSIIKELTLVIVGCGILFSLVSFFVRQEDIGPSGEIKESLKFLKELEEGDVLSDIRYGSWISYFANKNPVLHYNMKYDDEADKLFNQTTVLFESRNLKNAQELLLDLNVKYIYITPEMRSGLIWTDDKQGLQFLFRNDKVFKVIYEKDSIEIWKIVGQI